ncbi:hypothetical protein [Achromobacter sp. DH1f]|uniref:hypothetical protein n=1 Tax=Achromobacter sp. DH1f TaxID=1397275 RepID=UPI0004698F4E|nr:hypothetical protein [Achromobacter sp. DH1f]
MPDYISPIIAVIIFAFTAKQYLDVRRRELEESQTAHYHKLIRQLLVDDIAGGPFIDLQISAVYELSLMPARYNASSTIILRRLRSRLNGLAGHDDLAASIDDALGELPKKAAPRRSKHRQRLLSIDLAVALGLGSGCAVAAIQAAKDYFSISPVWMLVTTLSLTAAFLLVAHWFAFRLEIAQGTAGSGQA